MGLHDIDKSSDNRLKPSLNAHDSLPQDVRMAHGTFGVTLVNAETGDVAKLIVKDGKLQLQKNGITYVDASNGNIEIVNNNGNIKGRLGYRPTDGDGAIETPKPGQSL